MSQPKWRDKERRDAKILGNKPTPRSGGLWFAKGDSKGEKFLVENKTTDKENFTIQGKVWQKIYNEALIEGRMPLLSIEFGGKKVELVIMDKNDFITML